MKYRKLDENGDYILGRKTGEVLADAEAVAQAIRTKLLLWRGEWWEDQEEGLPMMQRILGFSNTQKAADILIRQRILATPNVVDVVSFDSSFDVSSRAYTCNAEVATAFGNILLSEELR